MIQYDVVVHRTAVSFLLGRPSRERRSLLHFLDGLGNDPYQSGDFEVTDQTGRRQHVKESVAFTSHSGRITQSRRSMLQTLKGFSRVGLLFR